MITQRGVILLLQSDDAKKLSQEMKESLDSVGFTYFLVMARIHDIDPRLAFSEGKSRVSHALRSPS